MERTQLVDHSRLGSNVATERYQPHHNNGRLGKDALAQNGAVGVISVIQRGPTGIGAVFSMAEPLPTGWHPVEQGAEPMVSRAVGA
jgi:hypothetical protein